MPDNMICCRKHYLFNSIKLYISILLVLSMHACETRAGGEQIDTVELDVQLVYLLDNLPINVGKIKVFTLQDDLVSEKSVDDQGHAVFELVPGKYIIRTGPGYSAKAEIDLQADRKILLRVLPINQ